MEVVTTVTSSAPPSSLPPSAPSPSTPSPSSPLPAQLRLAVLRLSRRMRQEAAGLVTPSQLSALTTIAKHGDLSLGELAAVERVAPPSMTRIAARLEESGLVARRTDAADRRVSRVVATDEGHALLEATQHRRDLFLATRLQELTDDERDLVARAVPVLERLARED